MWGKTDPALGRQSARVAVDLLVAGLLPDPGDIVRWHGADVLFRPMPSPLGRIVLAAPIDILVTGVLREVSGAGTGVTGPGGKYDRAGRRIWDAVQTLPLPWFEGSSIVGIPSWALDDIGNAMHEAAAPEWAVALGIVIVLAKVETFGGNHRVLSRHHLPPEYVAWLRSRVSMRYSAKDSHPSRNRPEAPIDIDAVIALVERWAANEVSLCRLRRIAPHRDSAG